MEPLFYLIFCVAAFGHDHVAIQDVMADASPGPAQRQALLAEIAKLHPHRLYVDAYAMQELYDYKLPPNAFCFETCSTENWGQPVVETHLPKDSVTVATVYATFYPSKPGRRGKRQTAQNFGIPSPRRLSKSV